MTRLSLLAVEPWLGGSHERFLSQWRERSRHAVEVIGLAARHWKWRMSAAPWELASQLSARTAAPPDALLVSDFLDLPAFLGFLPAGWRDLPTLVYFHENQLTYPLRPEEQAVGRDAHYGFTNVLTCLRAERACFNSDYHLQAFSEAARELLARLPRPSPARELERALERAAVITPGIDFDEIPLGPGPEPGAPLRIAFNHRWEHDKDPLAFLAAAARARRSGAAFELVLLGEHFDELPAGVAPLLAELAPVTLQRGYAPSRADYARWLGRCDLVVSTARHEFFGLSVCEALAAGCAPLLPRRLSYPGLLPAELHARAFYDADEELALRLVTAAETPAGFRDPRARAALRAAMRPHSADETARELDRIITELVPPRA